MTNLTPTVSASNHIKKWLLFDVRGLPLGRAASKICRYLRGKDKVYFSPNINCGDNVVVINSQEIIMTGKKWTDKIYYSHSEYPGGLKMKSAKFIHDKDPTKLMQMAIQRMLPKNRLARTQMSSLYIYPHEEHPHQGQKPIVVKLD